MASFFQSAKRGFSKAVSVGKDVARRTGRVIQTQREINRARRIAYARSMGVKVRDGASVYEVENAVLRARARELDLRKRRAKMAQSYSYGGDISGFVGGFHGAEELARGSPSLKKKPRVSEKRHELFERQGRQLFKAQSSYKRYSGAYRVPHL